MSAFDPKRSDVRYWPLADIPFCAAHVRFWGVKRTSMGHYARNDEIDNVTQMRRETDPCEAFGLVLLRLYRLKQPIEGPFSGVCGTIEGPCYWRFLSFTRRWLWGIRSARAFGAPSTHRPGRLLFQTIQIGGDGGGRLRAGRVMLPEEALEPENPCGLGHALWRFMTARTVGRVKLGGGLASLQIFLRTD